MIFQGLSNARNCLRPQTAPLIILAKKEDFYVTSQKISWDVVPPTFSYY